MYLCKVTGTTIATRKNESFRTAKLLVVQPVATDGEPSGANDMLALDPGFGAGVGDVVLVAKQGQVVHQIMHDTSVPANVIIVGVVDDWQADDDVLFDLG